MEAGINYGCDGLATKVFHHASFFFLIHLFIA
jgi:hypothetical protein